MIYQFKLIEKFLLTIDLIPHPFTDASSSVGLGFALGTAVKLKITDQLSFNLKDVAEIARDAEVSEIGAELILNCLEALGYAQKQGRKYGFTRRGFKNLSPYSAINFRHFILFCDYLYKSYLDLDKTIQSGKNHGASPLEKMTEYEWELFSRAMIDIARTMYKEVAKKIIVASTASKMLDLGGSHGLYSIGLCGLHPNLTSTIVDLPPVQKYADKCIEEYEAIGKVSFLPADFMKDEIPKNNDIILAFNIIHGFTASGNEQLAQKAYDALNQGGEYIILDQIEGIGGSSQMSKATTSFMALNLFHQAGGRTYSEQEVDAFAKKSGFKSTKLIKLNAPGFGIIICKK